MNTRKMMVIALVVMVAFATTAVANWSEDFDSYGNGTGIIGQGGWEGWGGDPTWEAFVTDFVSQSAPHSIDITPTSDIIHQFTEYSAGQVIVSAYCYVPSSAVGEQYFILLDQYDHGGTTNHWAVQVMFGLGVVESQFDEITLPLIYNQWVEFRVEIDFDLDSMHLLYGGDTLLDGKPWTLGSSNDGLGVLNLACMDLFSNAGDDIYWDDITITSGVTATDDATWGQVKALY
jgi:hypothetical protein